MNTLRLIYNSSKTPTGVLLQIFEDGKCKILVAETVINEAVADKLRHSGIDYEG